MSDEPEIPSGVLHEYRPSCARGDCTAWPAPGRPFCAVHEREIEAGVKPGLSEAQWVGGVPPEIAKAKADRLEAQYAEQERQAAENELVARLVKAGETEEVAREKAAFHLREKMAWDAPLSEATATANLRIAGSDPDTAYPAEALKQPFDPAAELRAYLDGAHGAVKQATARVLLDAMLMVLARL